MTWKYRVPQFSGSRWEELGLKAFDDRTPEVPTIGVYCARDGHEDYLIGSFSFHAESVMGQQWKFWRGYPTGAGEIIELPAGEDASFILRDKPLRGPHDGNLDTSAPAGRIRNKLKCRTCRYRVAFRREATQTALTKLWDRGFREVPLEFLHRCVGDANA